MQKPAKKKRCIDSFYQWIAFLRASDSLAQCPSSMANARDVVHNVYRGKQTAKADGDEGAGTSTRTV